MKVLFLTQVLPYPLDGGQKIRAYYMLRQLVEVHDVTLVSFVRDNDKPEHVEHLERYCQAVHTIPIRRSLALNVRAFLGSVIKGHPAVILRDNQKAMRRLLASLDRARTFDVIHADQTSMAQYALGLRFNRKSNRLPAIVLDQHNALYLVVQRQSRVEQGLKRWLWGREAHHLSSYERNLCRQFDKVITVTAEDKQALLSLFKEPEAELIEQRISSIPICVNVDTALATTHMTAKPKILHIGTMLWPPNAEGVKWFIRDVFPLILDKLPEAHLTVAGKNPPDSIVKLADSQNEMSANLTIVGYVNEPESLVSCSRAFVVPVRTGGGMRVKILDGWRWGLPIVSTSIGAEGIHYRDGENIMIGDSKEAFANAVLRILKDDLFAEQLRLNGWKWVKERYDWRKQYPRINAIYDQLGLAK